MQCCLCCLDGYRFINVFCINLAFISQPFCMIFVGFFFYFILKAIVILGNMVTKVHFTTYIIYTVLI